MDNPIDVAEVIRENEVLRAQIVALETSANAMAAANRNSILDHEDLKDSLELNRKDLIKYKAFAVGIGAVLETLKLGKKVDIINVRPGQLVSAKHDVYSEGRLIGWRTNGSRFVGVGCGTVLVYEYDEWSKWDDVRPVILP